MTTTTFHVARRHALRLIPAGIDASILFIVATLCSIGIVMVASASVSYADYEHQDVFYYLRRHLVYVAMGLTGAIVVLQVPLQLWYRYSRQLALLTILLLLVVLIPGIGHEVNGARRWIRLGIINFQVAEVAKFSAIIFIAAYIQRHYFALKEVWHYFFRPLAMIGAMALLLLAQPDFGSSVVILATVMVMFFLCGVRLWVFAGLLAVAGAALWTLAVTSPYRMKRLGSFLDPWSDMYNTGYQLTQSLIAFGRGEWSGVGLGNSVQKLFYLPEAHTDFVFAIFAEETGLMGVATVIALFVLLVHRIFTIARRAVQRQNWFAAYVGFGIGVLIAGQAFINIGMASGLLPTKGLTLPFISYGGSSLIVSLAMIALVLRISVEMGDAYWAAKKVEHGQR